MNTDDHWQPSFKVHLEPYHAYQFSSYQTALQAYHSQSMLHSYGATAAREGAPATRLALPPLLPMAVQLSQHAGAAAVASGSGN